LRVDRLREIREQQGITQRELARICALGENMINRHENGKSDPSASHLLLIASQLGISVDYLLGLASEPRGQLGNTALNRDEQEVVDALRRNGWNGVLRLAAERITQ